MSDQIPVYRPVPADREHADRVVAAAALPLLDRAYRALIHQNALIEPDRAVFGEAARLVKNAAALLRATEFVRQAERAESLHLPVCVERVAPAAEEPHTQP